MKNNFVSKHMNTYNKSSVHKDRKKEGVDKKTHIKEELQSISDENESKFTLDSVLPCSFNLNVTSPFYSLKKLMNM